MQVWFQDSYWNKESYLCGNRHPALKSPVMQLSTSYFSKRKKLKDTSNVKSVVVERKGPIERFFLHFFAEKINEFE